MSQDQIILDDGVYYVDLNSNYEPSCAPGFLERRCSVGMTTPGGFECVGNFDKALDGTWNASINDHYDPATDGDSRMLVKGVSRMDAITALWANRTSAVSVHQ